MLPEFGVFGYRCSGGERGPKACKRSKCGQFVKGIVGNIDFAVLLNGGEAVLAVEINDRSHVLTRRRDQDSDKRHACEKLGIHLCCINSPRQIVHVDQNDIQQTVFKFVAELAACDARVHRALHAL